jgi:hypothetical protein
MAQKLATMWTSHLKTEEDRKNFREYILGSNSLWDRLGAILKEKVPKPTVSDYSTASWAYFQADQNGYERALREILAILPIDK